MTQSTEQDIASELAVAPSAVSTSASATTSTSKPACPICNSNNVIRSGIRKGKNKSTQRYKCRSCNRIFTPQPLKRTSYPPNIILSAISLYNLGHSLKETRIHIRKKYKLDPKEPTILFWLDKYKDIITFTKLRKRYTLDPDFTIRSKKLYHTQVYNLKYHELKLNLAARKFPELRQYVKETFDHCPHKLFRADSPRCSSLKIDFKPRRNTKYNNAPKLAEFALLQAKTNKERHETVQKFMLVNDTATVATELPVYLHPDELPKYRKKSLGFDLEDTLTGHIDILQVRFNKVHILDYKPEAGKTDRSSSEQVFLYALLLSRRANIPLGNIVCAYFDERNYYQFKPGPKH